MTGHDFREGGSHPPLVDERELGGMVVGVVASGNVQADAIEIGQLSAEFIAAREPYWVKQERPVWGGCGDDRPITEQSAQELADESPETLSPLEGYASVYGGAAGIAKAIIITGIVQYGPDFVQKVGGFDVMLERVVRVMGEDTSDQAVKPILHSAEGNENADGTFCAHGEAATGCAYCGGVGATSDLLVGDDALIRNVARDEQVDTFGSDQYVDEILDAHRVFLELATGGKGGALAVDRTAYIKLVEETLMPVMILAGKHAAAARTGVITNFELGTIGSANQAHEAGMDFYRQDIAQITAAILRNFREYDLNPEILLRQFKLDETPVRAVLAAHDADPELQGRLDPRNLPAGFRGDPHAAIAALRQAA